METMADFIKRVRDKYNVRSDYEMGKRLGLTRQTMSAHKIGRAKHYSEETAYRIALLLGEDPAYVLLCLAAERAKDDEVKKTWETEKRGNGASSRPRASISRRRNCSPSPDCR